MKNVCDVWVCIGFLSGVSYSFLFLIKRGKQWAPEGKIKKEGPIIHGEKMIEKETAWD